VISGYFILFDYKSDWAPNSKTMKRFAVSLLMAKNPEEIPIHPEKPTAPPREDPTPLPGKIPEILPPVEPKPPGQRPPEIPNPDHPIKTINP